MIVFKRKLIHVGTYPNSLIFNNVIKWFLTTKRMPGKIEIEMLLTYSRYILGTPINATGLNWLFGKLKKIRCPMPKFWKSFFPMYPKTHIRVCSSIYTGKNGHLWKRPIQWWNKLLGLLLVLKKFKILKKSTFIILAPLWLALHISHISAHIHNTKLWINCL